MSIALVRINLIDCAADLRRADKKMMADVLRRVHLAQADLLGLLGPATPVPGVPAGADTEHEQR